MTMISNLPIYNNIISMKKILTLLIILLSFTQVNAQSKINYWTWSSNHLKQEPQKWNRYDSWNYMPRYYQNFTIVSFTLKPFKLQKPNNYFIYREKKKSYKFIF